MPKAPLGDTDEEIVADIRTAIDDLGAAIGRAVARGITITPIVFRAPSPTAARGKPFVCKPETYSITKEL